MKNVILTAKRNYFKILFKLSSNDFITAGVNGDTKKVQWYIDNGVDIDAGYQDGTNLLHYVCVGQDREMINLLIKNKANLNLLDHSHRTPLFIIAQESSELRSDVLSGPVKNPEEKNRQRKEISFLIAKDLIEHGANVNIPNSKGNTPLISACFKENEKLVDLLLEHHADVFVKNKEGSDAFECALNYRNISIINSIIMAAKNTDELDIHLQTIEKSKYPPQLTQQATNTIHTLRLKMTMENDLNVKDEPKQRPKKI